MYSHPRERLRVVAPLHKVRDNHYNHPQGHSHSKKALPGYMPRTALDSVVRRQRRKQERYLQDLPQDGLDVLVLRLSKKAFVWASICMRFLCSVESVQSRHTVLHPYFNSILSYQQSF
jgi:hypothetical protein